VNRIIVTLTIIGLFAAGCGSGIQAGTVVDKDYDDPDTYFISTYCGKGCFTMIPAYDGPHYKLKLQAGEETGKVEVDPATFERVQIGDEYAAD
jgi:hypothetical protein